jgi:hypothetical protein
MRRTGFNLTTTGALAEPVLTDFGMTVAGGFVYLMPQSVRHSPVCLPVYSFVRLVCACVDKPARGEH